MNGPIRSKLHQLLEAAEKQPRSLRLGKEVDASLNALKSSPLYIFSPETTELLISSEASDRSIKALAKMKLMHLPYPKMTAQFRGARAASEFTYFINLQEHDQRPGCFVGVTSWLHDPSQDCGISLFKINYDEAGFEVEVLDSATGIREAEAKMAVVGLRLAVLMTHLSGLEREVMPAPEKLNKKRVASGKPAIQAASYVHIARVYDREGRAHNYSEVHRIMPIHMRAGHIRNARTGKGRTETKMTWVRPCIVNYKPEVDGPPLEIKPTIKKVVR